MRAVIQRVLRASVRVGDDLVSSIDRGLCVLIGIASDDNQSDLEYIVRKLLGIRLWPSVETGNGAKNWTRNVVELDFSLLCVSQFTLHATLKGHKPDFHLSMGADKSKLMYEQLMNTLKQNYKPDKIHDGIFGAMMAVNIENDGPVTIILDSRTKKSNADTTMTTSASSNVDDERQ